MSCRGIRRYLIVGSLAVAFACPSAAAGAVDLTDPVNQWLPNSDGATWTYQWSDSAYAPTPTLEQYTLAGGAGSTFRLSWTTDGLGNGDGTVQSAGIIQYSRSELGTINDGWSATPAPSGFPILCPQASQCANSLAGTHFMAIWGTRSPILAEPLLRGARWTSTGGANNDVGSSNRYMGLKPVVVPAFPDGIKAAKIQSTVTQAGAIGDPYGSGTRTVWWVYGVGPVKVTMQHPGGEVTESELVSTNLAPLPPPSDLNYLPFKQGTKMTFSWTNSDHMKNASKQTFTVSQVSNNTARVDVQSKSGPIKVAGAYVFSTRLGGITNIAASTQAQSTADFPPLGPRSLPPKQRRHLLTPFDLMTFGFNPVLPAYPKEGDTWSGEHGTSDFKVFGVTGTSKILGVRKVKTPAGKFQALAVESRLRQHGFRYGSGRRISYFAPDEGLVKLVFHHGDGSVSTVERIH